MGSISPGSHSHHDSHAPIRRSVCSIIIDTAAAGEHDFVAELLLCRNGSGSLRRGSARPAAALGTHPGLAAAWRGGNGHAATTVPGFPRSPAMPLDCAGSVPPRAAGLHVARLDAAGQSCSHLPRRIAHRADHRPDTPLAHPSIAQITPPRDSGEDGTPVREPTSLRGQHTARNPHRRRNQPGGRARLGPARGCSRHTPWSSCSLAWWERTRCTPRSSPGAAAVSAPRRSSLGPPESNYESSGRFGENRHAAVAVLRPA